MTFLLHFDKFQHFGYFDHFNVLTNPNSIYKLAQVSERYTSNIGTSSKIVYYETYGVILTSQLRFQYILKVFSTFDHLYQFYVAPTPKSISKLVQVSERYVLSNLYEGTILKFCVFQLEGEALRKQLSVSSPRGGACQFFTK